MAAAAASVDKTEYVSGYMPLRGDFDVEHDNDAELILADMEFSPDSLLMPSIALLFLFFL